MVQYCLLHKVAVTKIWFVCRTESLQKNNFFVSRTKSQQRTKILYVAKKIPKCAKNYEKIKKKKNAKMAQKSTKNLEKCFRIVYFLALFGILLATYTNFVCHRDSVQETKNLFVTVTQCDKQNKSWLQWLSATNNTEKNTQFLCGIQQRIWRKNQNKHIFIFEFHHCYQIAFGTLVL